MQPVERSVRAVNWDAVTASLHRQGYALVPRLLTDAQCEHLIGAYDDAELYRKTVNMARHRFGLGEYKYFRDPLPDLVAPLRAAVYPRLVPLANDWMAKLGLEREFLDDLAGLRDECRAHGQTLPTPLILKYGPGGYNTLHQDLYGDMYCPLQAAFVLSRPGLDFSGGAFVMTEQVPRAQSRPIVLEPGRGDMLVFTTNFRPAQGARVAIVGCTCGTVSAKYDAVSGSRSASSFTMRRVDWRGGHIHRLSYICHRTNVSQLSF